MQKAKFTYKNFAITILILLEIVVIWYFINQISLKKVGQISVVYIDSPHLNFPQDDELQFYYEFKPSLTANTHNTINLDSMNTINSDLLNEQYDYEIQKPDETYRIITLGDSWTYGLGVDTKSNFSEVLENMLNSKMYCQNIKKFEVINLGVPGYDIQYEVERFKRQGKKYQPDLVLWFLIQNDFSEINEFFMKRTEKILTDIVNSQGEKPRDKSYLKQSYPLRIQSRLQALKDQDTVFPEEKRLEYQAIALESINKYFNKQLMIYSLAHVVQLRNGDKRIIEEFIKKRPESYYYEDPINLRGLDALLPNNHPNNLGHKLIAENLFKYMNDNKIIPCN